MQTFADYYDSASRLVRADVSTSGAGWACVAKPRETLCRIDGLRSGHSATLTMRIRTPDLATRLDVFASLFAEARHDPNPNDNFVVRALSVGNVEDYERVLLPVTIVGIPGQGGTLWHTAVRMFIDSPVPIALPRAVRRGHRFPSRAGRARAFRSVRGVARVSHASRRTAAHRSVRDLANPEDRWGTEIPAVREREFRSSKFVLMPLPVGSAFRHTLRVYDRDGRDGAQVEIRVHAAGDLGARATLTRTLTVAHQQLTSPAKLPRFPAYLELDPLRGVALPADREAWLQIEPLTEGLRLWGFVTVTDNANGRVTTVTPQ